VNIGDPEESLDVPESAGIAATAEYNSLMARVGYSQIELGTSFAQVRPLIDTLNALPAAFCGACANVAQRFNLEGLKIDLFDVGAQYDDGANIVIAEYASRSSGSYVIADMYSAYATVGRRFGGLTPYASYALTRRDEVDQLTLSMTGPLAPMSRAINGAVNGALSIGDYDQDTISVGLRYEVPSFSVLSGALVKLQFDHIDAKDTGGMFIAVQPGFDGEVNMVSVSFDFIF
jgi:hypothetical protein